MFDLTLVTIGKLKDEFYAGAAAQYLKRLKPYARLKLVELPAVAWRDNNHEAAKALEGQRISNFLRQTAQAKIFLLAERGRSFNSEKFALWLEDQAGGGQSLVLVISGALGFSAALYERYPAISLSPLTFPHELARVVLLEQIYRAATILKNKTYHY